MPEFHKLKGTVNARLKQIAHTLGARRSSRLEHFLVSLNFERLADTLKKAGLAPATVFDIGVAYGTPWLYSAFPRAKFHLIDPTLESLPHMRQAATYLDAHIHNVALGDARDRMTINVRSEIGASSLYEEVASSDITTSYAVDVIRFDEIIREFTRPALCKIDVQGAEMAVLRGMGDHIRSFDVVIIESSLLATLKGNAPELGEVVAFMQAHGYVVYDIVGMTRRPLDQTLAQIDVAFVPSDSPLRADRRWG